MTRYYEPDLTVNPDSPFVRDASNKLVRRAYWIDMPDATLVMVMTKGIGANLTNDEKRAHLIDLKRQQLIAKYAFRRFCRLKCRGQIASADDDSTIAQQFPLDITDIKSCRLCNNRPNSASLNQIKRTLSQF